MSFSNAWTYINKIRQNYPEMISLFDPPLPRTKRELQPSNSPIYEEEKNHYRELYNQIKVYYEERAKNLRARVSEIRQSIRPSQNPIVVVPTARNRIRTDNIEIAPIEIQPISDESAMDVINGWLSMAEMPVIDLFSIPTREQEEKARLEAFLSRQQQLSKVQPGYVKLCMDVKYKVINGIRKNKTAKYNTQATEVKGSFYSTVINDIRNIRPFEGSYDIFTHYKKEGVSDIKSAYYWISDEIKQVCVELTDNEYQYISNLNTDDMYQMLVNLNINIDDVFERAGYNYGDLLIQYVGSDNVIVFFPNQGVQMNNRSSKTFEDRELFGILTQDGDIDYNSKEYKARIKDIRIKHEELTYGDQTNKCVPMLVKKCYKESFEWDASNKQIDDGFKISDIDLFAKRNNLSYYLVNEENVILSHNVGTKDIMNHKHALIGMIIGNHIYEVHDKDLRKSIVEGCKYLDERKDYEDDPYYEEEEEPELDELIDIRSEQLGRELTIEEEEELYQKLIDKKEATQANRAAHLAMFEARIEVQSILELEFLIRTPSPEPKYVLYNGNFLDVMKVVIISNVQEKNVYTIPSRKSIKYHQGKIEQIIFNNYYIRRAIDEDALGIYYKCSAISGDDFKDASPLKSINENIKDYLKVQLPNIESTLNSISSKFLNATCTQDYCRPLDNVIISPDELVGHGDLSKAYQVAACDLSYGDYAKFDGLEIYNEYTGQNIEAHGFYYIDSTSNSPFYQGAGVYEGSKVITLLKYNYISLADVKSFIISKDTYPRQTFEDFIVNTNKLFGADDAKSIVVNVIGNFKPNTEKRYRNNIITMDLQIVYDKLTKYGTGFGYEVIDLNGVPLFNICKRTEYELYKTARPIHMAIKDRTGSYMIELYQAIKKSGSIPFFIKTDNIFYKNVNNHTVELIESNFTNRTHLDLPAFGTLKHSTGKYSDYQFNSVWGNQSIEKLPNIIKPTNYIYTEDNSQAFAATLDHLNGYQCPAPAGFGKTELFKNQEKHFIREDEIVYQFGTNESLKVKPLMWDIPAVMKLAYTNTAVTITDGKTFHRSFKLSKLRNRFYKIQPTLKRIADNYDYIMCDECSMITKVIYECLTYMKLYRPSIKIMLYGDWRQLAPVEPEIEVSYDYSSLDIVSFLTDFNRVVLTKNYRSGENINWTDIVQSADPKILYHKSLTNYIDKNGVRQVFGIYQISSKLASFVKVVPENTPISNLANIAYTNDKCNSVNKSAMVIHSKKKGKLVTVPSKLKRLNNRQDIILFNGLRLLAKANIYNYSDLYKNDHLHTNEHYIVTDITDLTFSVKMNEAFANGKKIKSGTYLIEDLHKFFILGYCFTSHASQGLTIKEYYSIHEFSKMCFMDIKALYTSLTRCKDPSRITLFGNCQ